ncbi:MAG: zinc ribbon domain-containing protein [Lachnospiraceae bacterium]|nr:zinc ribbon domain-containing protein [Lachnospiraceae bacterium]
MVAGIIGAILFILVLAATIAIHIFVLPESKYDSLPPALQHIHNFLNMKVLWVDLIMRFLYIFGTIAIIPYSIYMMFKASFISGLLTLIFTPVVLRITYELLMMTVMIARNVIELNRKTPWPKGMKPQSDPAPIPTKAPAQAPVTPPPAPVAPAPAPVAPAPVAPAPVAPAPAPSEPAPAATNSQFCTKCGAKVEPDSMFCTACGNKLK